MVDTGICAYRPSTHRRRAGRAAEPTAVYRPRHPERTAFYRLLDAHLARYLGTYEERFEPRYGPLRRVVPRTAEAFLECGRLKSGFARIRCPRCRGEHLLAFSCQTRNFCPSCQAKRAALFAEKLREEILAPVAHRHVVFTIPRALRGLFERDRRLLGLLSRCAYEALRRTWAVGFEDARAVPGMVASIQTFGSFANFHPHIHALVTNGVVTGEGEFVSLPRWTPEAVEAVFRRLVLRRLVQAERLSETFRDALLTWERSGFSVYGEQVVLETEGERLERVARYVVRAPMPFEVVEAMAQEQVRITTPPDPRTGERELVLDPLEFVHAMCRQVPDPRQHLVRYYGLYANRSRKMWQGRWGRGDWGGPVTGEGEDSGAGGDGPGGRSGVRAGSWARLLRRILEVDPLLCPRCEVAMVVVSVITEPRVVDRILEHVAASGGDDPFAERAPPGAEDGAAVVEPIH
jgi:hypothetical protein